MGSVNIERSPNLTGRRRSLRIAVLSEPKLALLSLISLDALAKLLFSFSSDSKLELAWHEVSTTAR
jgi:hypothetical protein